MSSFISASVLLCLEGLVSLVSSSLTGSYNLSTSSSIGFPDPIVAVTLMALATLELRTRQQSSIVLELGFTDLCVLDTLR